jgi:hypothetical protein
MGHVNPIICKCFKEYHQKFGGRVMPSKIMKAANIDWPQMPYLLMCVECAASRSVHAKPKVVMFRVTRYPDFCRELCQKLKPGIEYVLRNNEQPSPTKKQRLSGYGGK